MKHTVIWFEKTRGPGIALGAGLDRDVLERQGLELRDGLMAYRSYASDEATWVELTVRVQPGELPHATDLSLHTALHDDPCGDRWRDYTSALMGDGFVGYIRKLHEPSPSFWSAMEKHCLEYDAMARAAYAKDMEAGMLAAAAMGFKSGSTPAAAISTKLEFKSAWRVCGANGHTVLIEAPDIPTVLTKYIAHVDETIAALGLGVNDGVVPVYDIDLIDKLDPITIIP